MPGLFSSSSGNVHGCQEFRVKIARGEFEDSGPMVVKNVFVRPFFPDSPHHSGPAVIVGGYRQGPGAQRLVIFLQKTGGGPVARKGS